MQPKDLLRKWPSVSAAVAMLLGMERTEASSADVTISENPKNGDPFEPLLLKPSKTQIIPERLFAGHRSHSSHASHASGSSSRSYVPSRPNYVVPSVPRPSVVPSYSAPAATPRTSPKPALAPTPTPNSLTRIELTNGAVIYGTVLVKSAAGITLKGIDQKSYKIPRLILTPSTIASLALPSEQ